MEQTSEKSAAICPYSILPQICGQSANDRDHKYDSKYHISAYDYNTRTGFRAHKNIWRRGRLSSALVSMDIPWVFNISETGDTSHQIR